MTFLHRRSAMLRLVPVFSLAIALPLLASVGANTQDAPADITVVSVLTMAKDEAEKAPDEDARIDLRHRVARSMMKTGQTSSFGTYSYDARNALHRRDVLRAEHNETAKFNLEAEGKAKQALLAGDDERAMEFLRQCRPLWLWHRCGSAMTQGMAAKVLFTWWEIEEGRLAAAWHRLKAMEWPPEMQARMLINLGTYIAAGDRDKLLGLRQLVEAAGGKFESCVMKEQFPDSVGSAAELRELACNGQMQSALDIARSQSGSGPRTHSLLVIAEGMAGVPGFSGEPLF
jgi:hypothetical protein